MKFIVITIFSLLLASCENSCGNIQNNFSGSSGKKGQTTKNEDSGKNTDATDPPEITAPPASDLPKTGVVATEPPASDPPKTDTVATEPPKTDVVDTEDDVVDTEDEKLYNKKKNDAQEVLTKTKYLVDLIDKNISEVDYFKNNDDIKNSLNTYGVSYDKLLNKKDDDYRKNDTEITDLVDELNLHQNNIIKDIKEYQTNLASKFLLENNFENYINQIQTFADINIIKNKIENAGNDNQLQTAVKNINKLTDENLKQELFKIEKIKAKALEQENYDKILLKVKDNNNFTKDDFQSLNENYKQKIISEVLISYFDINKKQQEINQYKKEFLGKIIDYANDDEDIFLNKNTYIDTIFNKINELLYKEINDKYVKDDNMIKKVKNYFTKRSAFFITTNQEKDILKNNYNTEIFNTKNNEKSAKAWIKLLIDKNVKDYELFRPFHFKYVVNYFFLKDYEFDLKKEEIIKKTVIKNKDDYKAIMMRNADPKVIDKVLRDYLADTNNYKNQQIYQEIISCGLLNGDEIIFTKDLENSKLQALIEIIQNKPDILLYFLKNHAYPSDKEIIKEWFAKDDNQTKYKFLYFTIQSQE